jgi:hypothetical protein
MKRYGFWAALFALLLCFASCAGGSPVAPLVVAPPAVEPLSAPVHSPVHSPIVSHANAWTPSEAAPTFFLDAATLAHTTTVAQAKDAAGGAYVLTQHASVALPAYDTTHTCNGYPSLALTSAGETLWSASGPPWGSDKAGSFYSVCLLSATQYPVALAVGDPAHSTGNDLYVGARQSSGSKFWAGGNSGGGIGPVAGANDGYWHFVEHHYSGGTSWLYVDGVLVGTGAFSFNTSGTFPTGFGVAPQSSASFEGASNVTANVYRLSGMDSLATQVLHRRWAARRYVSGGDGTKAIVQLTDEVAGVGDSLVKNAYNDAGTADPTNSAIALLSSQSGMGSWACTALNDGHPGATSAQLLTYVIAVGGSASTASPFRRNNIAFLLIGSNDVFTSVATATTQANILTSYSTLLASGMQAVVVVTVPYWIGYAVSAFDGINNWIRSTFPNVYDLNAKPWANYGLVTTGTNVTGTYGTGGTLGTYRCDSGSAVGHLTATGQAAAAADLAAMFLALKR